MPEWTYFVALAVNTMALLITLGKILWGSGQGLQSQFHMIDQSVSTKVDQVKADWLARHEALSQNIGNVTVNISDRIHQIELKAMEFRAITAETLQLYMRREDYNKAADEFKRDVRDAHDDLKEHVQAGFKEVREQIEAVSQTIETNRKNAHSRA